MIVLLFGTAVEHSSLSSVVAGACEVLPLSSKEELLEVLRSAELLENDYLLVLAPATAAELDDMVSLSSYIDSHRTVSFASREVYLDPRILQVRPRYVGVCDEHAACVREVLRRVSTTNRQRGSMAPLAR